MPLAQVASMIGAGGKDDTEKLANKLDDLIYQARGNEMNTIIYTSPAVMKSLNLLKTAQVVMAQNF